jgi:hypothetical protein
MQFFDQIALKGMWEIEAKYSLTASLTADSSSDVTVKSGVTTIQQHEVMVAVPRCGPDMGQNGA